MHSCSWKSAETSVPCSCITHMYIECQKVQHILLHGIIYIYSHTLHTWISERGAAHSAPFSRQHTSPTMISWVLVSNCVWVWMFVAESTSPDRLWKKNGMRSNVCSRERGSTRCPCGCLPVSWACNCANVMTRCTPVNKMVCTVS